MKGLIEQVYGGSLVGPSSLRSGEKAELWSLMIV